jgi:hypothetical protein
MALQNQMQFAQKLTVLCGEFGLGLTGATVFTMEPGDFCLSYRIDENSCLDFGVSAEECAMSARNSALGASQEQFQSQCLPECR